jgi:hypothetical protein
MIARAPLSLIGFTKASNYINKKGEHPNILSAIDHWKIVLKAEYLDDNNWLYIGKEPEEKVKWQISVLKQFRDWVPIIKE